MAAQVGLTLVLGIGAGLMLRSVWNLQHVDPGFDRRRRPVVPPADHGEVPRARRPALPYLREVAARVAGPARVTAVGAIGHLPMSGYAWTIPASRRPAAGGRHVGRQVGWRFIWGDYFEAMRIPVVAGRRFTDADVTTSAPVALVNETLAREFFGEPARGTRPAPGAEGRRAATDDTAIEIVGVVGDVRHQGLDGAPRPGAVPAALADVHVPDALGGPHERRPRQRWRRRCGAPSTRWIAAVPVPICSRCTTLLVGTLGAAAAAAPCCCRSSRRGRGAAERRRALRRGRVRVRQREREIGIRMALGALPGAMARAVVRQGWAMPRAGVAVGLPAAFALTRFMESVVFGVTTRDPLTFAVLPVLLAAVTALACYLPARRAARVDPVVAIRTDAS